MKEQDLNTYIKNSFPWGYKIPDPGKMEAIRATQRCFDGFGILPNRVVFFESKLMKGFQAFSFSHIKEHQIRNLMAIKEVTAVVDKIILPLLFLGVHVPEKRELWLFAFDIVTITNQIAKGKKSFTKKDLEAFQDKGLCLRAHKGIFPFLTLDTVIITPSMLEEKGTV